MKKKSPRGIPDFSPKKPGFQQRPQDTTQPKPPQPHNAPKIKPQSTSSKSGGRRGG